MTEAIALTEAFDRIAKQADFRVAIELGERIGDEVLTQSPPFKGIASSVRSRSLASGSEHKNPECVERK